MAVHGTKTFMALFCLYNPDNFRGYFRTTVKADDMAGAEELARDYINKNAWHWKGDVEYQVYEIAAENSGRLWNVAAKTHR